MAKLRNQTGSRTGTQGQFSKPGVYFPTPGSLTDILIVESKTVDSKDATVAYLTAHPVETTALLVKQEFSGFEDGKKTRTRTYRTLPGAATLKYMWDDSLRTYVEIQTQDVAIGTAGPTAAAEPRLLEINDAITDMGWTTRTIVRIPSAITMSDLNREEYRTEQFMFPAILAAGSPVATPTNTGFGNVQTAEDTSEWVGSGRYTVYTVLTNIRPAISVPTIHKVETSFYTTATKPAASTVFTVLPNNIRADGRLVNFSLGDVINNGFTVSATASTYDAQLAGLTEEFIFGASSPNTTDYNADVTAGNWKIIASEVVHYRGNIWIKINTSVKLK